MKKDPLIYDIEVFNKMNMVGFMDKTQHGYVMVNAPYLPSSNIRF